MDANKENEAALPEQPLESAGVDSEALVSELYSELRTIAARLMRRERGATLQPTALIHEVYLKLHRQTKVSFVDKNHFLAVACQAMRRVVVDHVRKRSARKRGGRLKPVTLHEGLGLPAAQLDDILTVDALLAQLLVWDERLGKLVELRYFGGFTTEEAAAILGVTYDQARRDWTVARAWFRARLHTKESP
jgi:RNA polymerase sigma-70 factor (ECF subfamily)